jgi:hypothetical protein
MEDENKSGSYEKEPADLWSLGGRSPDRDDIPSGHDVRLLPGLFDSMPPLGGILFINRNRIKPHIHTSYYV